MRCYSQYVVSQTLIGVLCGFLIVALYYHLSEKFTVLSPDDEFDDDVDIESAVRSHDFQWIMNQPDMCDDNPFAVFIVHSKPNNYDERRLFRKTFGNKNLQKVFNFRVIYALGYGNTNIDRLRQEEFYNRDMTMGNFLDSTYNDTLKVMSWLSFVSTYCNAAKFVIKLDDTMFFDPWHEIEYLRNMTESATTFYGIPIRDTVVDDYLDESDITEYATGRVIVAPMELIQRTAEEAQKSKFIWNDSYFLTGYLMQYKLGATLQSLNNDTFQSTNSHSSGNLCADIGKYNIMNAVYRYIRCPYTRPRLELWNMVVRRYRKLLEDPENEALMQRIDTVIDD